LPSSVVCVICCRLPPRPQGLGYLPLDILPALKGEDSPKGSSRLRVSSVVKYAFASHVSGCRPIVTEGVRYSACSRVKAAFRPGHAGRFHGTNTVRPSTAGYSARTVPPFASDPWAGTWRSGSESTPDLLPREKSRRSRGAVKDGVSRRGNSGTAVYGGCHNQAYGAYPRPEGRGFAPVFHLTL